MKERKVRQMERNKFKSDGVQTSDAFSRTALVLVFESSFNGIYAYFLIPDHHKNVSLRGIGAHEFLDLFALGHETDHGARVGLRVDLVLLLETFVKMLSEPKVKVATADVRIASRGQHL